MTSRFLLSFLLPLGLLASCGPDKHTARLTGNIKGVDQAAIIAYASAEAPPTGAAQTAFACRAAPSATIAP